MITKNSLRLLFLLCICFSLGAQERFIIATPGFDHPIAAAVSLVLPEIYKRLGFTVVFLQLPPNRAQLALSDGTADAYIFADMAFLLQYPKAIPVPVPLGRDRFVAFVRNESPDISGPESLRNLRVGYQAGMIPAEQIVMKYGGIAVPAQDSAKALQMLSLRRTDAVILPDWMGEKILRANKIPDIRISGSALNMVEVYHFLSPRRSSLLEKLSVEFAITDFSVIPPSRDIKHR